MFTELETSKEGTCFDGFKVIRPDAPAMPRDKEQWRAAMEIAAAARKGDKNGIRT